MATADPVGNCLGASDVADTKEAMTAGTAPREHVPPAEDAIREAAERYLRALAGPRARR